LPAGNPSQSECLADIQAVRDHETQRIQQDVE
jgi:hypothetical protein